MELNKVIQDLGMKVKSMKELHENTVKQVEDFKEETQKSLKELQENTTKQVMELNKTI